MTANLLSQWLGTVEPVLIVPAAPIICWELALRLGAPHRAMVVVEDPVGEGLASGIEASDREVIRVCRPAGAPLQPSHLNRFLASPAVDAVVLALDTLAPESVTHLHQLAAVIQAHPPVLFLAFGREGLKGSRFDFLRSGLDLLVTGPGPLLGSPPGVSLVAVSTRYIARARAEPGRGQALDLVGYYDDARQAAADELPPGWRERLTPTG